jgi:hypothetical protein
MKGTPIVEQHPKRHRYCFRQRSRIGGRLIEITDNGFIPEASPFEGSNRAGRPAPTRGDP